MTEQEKQAAQEARDEISRRAIEASQPASPDEDPDLTFKGPMTREQIIAQFDRLIAAIAWR